MGFRGALGSLSLAAVLFFGLAGCRGPAPGRGIDLRGDAADNRPQGRQDTTMTKKILVCDDEPYILMALTDAVEMEGYECVTAINGKEALQKARETLPDLIMLDIMMPFMDGFEVCRELKADAATRDIPVIMLTAKSQQVDIQKGKDAGADDYITKPFRPSTLRKKFNEVLDARHIIEEE